MNTDEKLDKIIVVVEHLAKDMDALRTELQEFRAENAKEHELMRNQIASVAVALNQTIVENNVRYEELKANDEALKANDEELRCVQEQHSIDIMKLRAAI